MLNSKRNKQSRSRSKSIYKGDENHTISMQYKIEYDVSPDKGKYFNDLHLQNKYSQKESKIQAFRDSLKINQGLSNTGKKTNRERDEGEKSRKKIVHMHVLETERPSKSITHQCKNKEISKMDKQISFKQNLQNISFQNCDKIDKIDKIDRIAVDYDEFKDLLLKIKKMSEENDRMKKQKNFIQKNKTKYSSTVLKALH